MLLPESAATKLNGPKRALAIVAIVGSSRHMYVSCACGKRRLRVLCFYCFVTAVPVAIKSAARAFEFCLGGCSACINGHAVLSEIWLHVGESVGLVIVMIEIRV